MLSNVLYDLKMGFTMPMYDGNREASLKVLNEKMPQVVNFHSW